MFDEIAVFAVRCVVPLYLKDIWEMCSVFKRAFKTSKNASTLHWLCNEDDGFRRLINQTNP